MDIGRGIRVSKSASLRVGVTQKSQNSYTLSQRWYSMTNVYHRELQVHIYSLHRCIMQINAVHISMPACREQLSLFANEQRSSLANQNWLLASFPWALHSISEVHIDASLIATGCPEALKRCCNHPEQSWPCRWLFPGTFRFVDRCPFGNRLAV